MLEAFIEERLVDEVKALGGIALKFTPMGYNGMPDRVVLLPGGRMCFVEFKAPSKKPTPLQNECHRLLRSLGYRVFVVDSIMQIGVVLDAVLSS